MQQGIPIIGRLGALFEQGPPLRLHHPFPRQRRSRLARQVAVGQQRQPFGLLGLDRGGREDKRRRHGRGRLHLTARQLHRPPARPRLHDVRGRQVGALGIHGIDGLQLRRAQLGFEGMIDALPSHIPIG